MALASFPLSEMLAATTHWPHSYGGTTMAALDPGRIRQHPVVLEQQAKRAQDFQLRIADRITAFAGSTCLGQTSEQYPTAEHSHTPSSVLRSISTSGASVIWLALVCSGRRIGIRTSRAVTARMRSGSVTGGHLRREWRACRRSRD